MSDEKSVRVQVNSLLGEARILNEGPAKIALLEEAARLADLHGHVMLGYQAREELVSACVFGGVGDKALAAFSWCLGQFDREPNRFDAHGLLWKYKWMINELIDYPDIPLARIEAAIEDMSERYRRHGYSPRPIHDARESLAIHVGDKSEARRQAALWAAAKRDALANCLACERGGEVWRLIFDDRPEEAIVLAEPLLEGRMSCKRQPAGALANVLVPLFDLGRIDEAMRFHQKGYRMIERERDYLMQISSHLDFLCLTDNLAKGVKLLERHLGWCFGNSINYRHRFEFSKSAWFLSRRLLATGRATIKLRLPRDFPLFVETNVYQKSALAAWFEADARAIAARFDARNGTDSFMRSVDKNLENDAEVQPFPLRPSTKKSEEADDE